MVEPKTQTSWILLIILAAIWGGSFMFVGVAVKELPALLIVLARVFIAALVLLPIHLLVLGRLPRDLRTWVACGGMSIMNNVIPFTLIAWGQHHIASGLASVINATTPMFAAAYLAMFGMETIGPRKIIALVVGLIGVVVLQGGKFGDIGPQKLGIIAVLIASSFYGLSAPWSKKMLVGIPPLTTATCQLTISSIVMAIIVLLFADPLQYQQASNQTWAAIIALAVISTAVAYLLFFRIIENSGPAFVSLVTMLVPVSAIALGYAFLNEKLTLHEFVGTLIIGTALFIIDGRVLKYFKMA